MTNRNIPRACIDNNDKLINGHRIYLRILAILQVFLASDRSTARIGYFKRFIKRFSFSDARNSAQKLITSLYDGDKI